MKKFAITSIVTAGLAAGLLGFAAPAIAAPAATGSAQQTINELEAQGYHVIVTRVGSAPLSEANVVSVRHGQSVPTIDTGDDHFGHGYGTTRIAYQTVYVDVA